MDRSRLLGRSPAEEYEPLTGTDDTAPENSTQLDGLEEIPFSWIEYTIFAFLGVAMLWAW
jgi:equilibrative nucleoside transporter 1/2/3